MDRVPREVFDHIIDQMSIKGTQLQSHPRPTLVPVAVDSPIATIKALRLRNKKLAEWTVCHLFKEILLYFTAKSYSKMKNVAGHPSLQHHVHELKIAPRSVFCGLSAYPDAKLCKRQFRSLLECMRKNYEWSLVEQSSAQSEHASASKWPKALDFTRKNIKRLFTRYSKEYDKQRKLYSDRNDDQLTFAISRFSQLKGVEPGKYWYWINHREESPLGSDDRLALLKFSFPIPVLSEGELVYALRAIGRGLKASGVERDISPLLKGLDARTMGRMMSKDSVMLYQLLFHATAFELDIGIVPYSPRYAMLHADGLRILKALIKVEGLYLKSTSWGDRVPVALDEWEWPRLQYLSLKGFDVVLQDLSTLLQRHKSTLRRLRLLELSVRWGLWLEVLSSLRDTALEKLQICRADVDEDEDVTKANLSDHWLPSTHPICRFVFGGEPWSVTIEADCDERCYRPFPGEHLGWIPGRICDG